MNATLLTQYAGLLRAGVILAVAVHAFALVPQFRAKHFKRRYVNTSVHGLVLAVAHGAVLVLAGTELAAGDTQRRAVTVTWCLGIAILLNLVVAVQNLLAVVALVRLHRPSAVIAYHLRAAVQPMVWSSAALASIAYGAIHGWF
ncbi:hypothetical protein [Massilia sp. METH4]|uniref:hypothetical protein n=1 Tax=Massilia sp. METH4 TaxID=3123041 RepID=UPI0030D18CD2